MLRHEGARDASSPRPFVPSMLTGRPIATAPTIFLRSSSSSSAAASSENFLRMITGRGWAKDRPLSDTATPIVFSPRSSPASVLPPSRAAARSVVVMTGKRLL